MKYIVTYPRTDERVERSRFYRHVSQEINKLAGQVFTATGAEAAFSQGSGNTVNDNSTFGGYTLQQVVQALRDRGLLA